MTNKRVSKVAVCHICGKSFEVQHNRQLYCSKECSKIVKNKRKRDNYYQTVVQREETPKAKRKATKYPFNIYVNHL